MDKKAKRITKITTIVTFIAGISTITGYSLKSCFGGKPEPDPKPIEVVKDTADSTQNNTIIIPDNQGQVFIENQAPITINNDYRDNQDSTSHE